MNLETLAITTETPQLDTEAAKPSVQCPNENRCIHAGKCLFNCGTGPGKGHGDPVEQFLEQDLLEIPVEIPELSSKPEELALSGLSRANISTN